MSRSAICLLILFTIPVVSYSAIIKVPKDYSTIQAAIDAASKGDAIYVSPGEYKEHINFKGKAILLRSISGPSKTIIDGLGKAPSPVTFESGEGLNCGLTGFTIRNGLGPFINGPLSNSKRYGGGILCRNYSSPQIINNIIENCEASCGGAICCIEHSYPFIMSNIITENSAQSTNSSMKGAAGGGIFVYTTPPGIPPSSSTVVILNNLIINNIASSATDSAAGGGIYTENCIINLMNNTISGNVVQNCGKLSWGGGVVTANDGGIYRDNIIWGNHAKDLAPELSHTKSTDLYEYCDIKGGSGNWWFNQATCIDTDPLFISGIFGDYCISHIAAGQSSDSPCIDTGSNLASSIGISTRWTRSDGCLDEGMVDIGFHYGQFYFSSLISDTDYISASSGGLVTFGILAVILNANRKYILLGSITGTTPGLPLPGNSVTLPINWDLFTNFIAAHLNTPVFRDFLGTLNSGGASTAALNTFGPLNPNLIGQVLSFAYALKGPWDFVSGPVSIDIVP